MTSPCRRAIRLLQRSTLGIAAHVITGVNRLDQTRVFSDSRVPGCQAERRALLRGLWSWRLARYFGWRRRSSLATVLRSDSKVDVDRDSSRSSSVDLPYTPWVPRSSSAPRGP
jgi:hypothetical protein